MAKHYLGIDVGGTNLAAGVLDDKYNLLAKSRLSTDPKRPFDLVVRDIVKAGKMALSDAGLAESDIKQICSLIRKFR